MEITLYKPNKWQKIVQKDKSRFLVLCLGRRAGKTYFALNRLIYKALTVPGQYWYVAPTYKQAKQIAWRQLQDMFADLPEELRGKVNQSELSVEIGNSIIYLKGAENEDSLRGSSLAGMVLDECAFYFNFEYLWNNALRPALADKEGWCIFVSTPNGFNYFYDLYEKHESYHFSSKDNEFLPSTEVDEMQKEMTEIQFKQEVLAEFIPQGSYQYFHGVEHIVRTDISNEPDRSASYLIGCDIARHHDSTVLIAINQGTNKIEGYESFDDLDWPMQKYRIANFSRKYNNGLVVIDATNNSSIGEDLMQEGIAIEQFVFTHKSKMEIYEKLRLYIQEKAIGIPKIEKLIDELNKFEFKYDNSMIKLGTQGSHDDCVAALALAVKNLSKLEVIEDIRRIWPTK